MNPHVCFNDRFLARIVCNNYEEVQQKIMMADGRSLSTVGMGDLHIELPNGLEKMKTVFRNAVHAPGMAFTLISISKLDKAGFLVTFNKGMCTIKNHKSNTVATIFHSNRLYKIAANHPNASSMANAASEKMSISEVHRKLGHVLHFAMKHAIVNSLITGIDLDINSKFKSCEACAKAKSACQPFPKESDTRAKKFGERIH
jgi:hypothetical protein